MKKFKLIALALLASTFGLASCDLPEFVQVPVDWANSNIVDPIKDLIPGGEKDKEEEEDPGEETKDEVVSVSISGLPSSVSDESAAFKLTATVEVKGNASKGVSWSSSNEAVATVDSEGLVTPKGAGEVTITATSTADSSKSGSVTFSVSCVAKVISVSVYGAPASVTDESAAFKLTATVEVKGNASKEVIWSSSNENVAKVDASGLVTPVGAGDVTITATSKVDSSKYGFVTFSVSVVPGVSSVKISGLPEDISDETAPFQLSATVQAKGGASEEVIWSSSDSSIASVSESGLVTLTGKAGEVSITATSKVDSSKSDSVSFEVYVLPAILSVEIEGAPESPVILYKDEVKLTAEVESKGTIASSVTWSSSDESIATVKDGVVTFLKAGEVTITATANKDSSKSDSVTISAIYKGLHPELLDEGYEFSDEWPEELLEAFAGVDAPVLECVHGFYYKENAPVIDETTGEQSKAGTFRVVADYVDISLMDDFEAAAEEMGYYEFVDTYYASYGFYTFCFLDPSLKAEIDFDYYAGSEEGDTFSFIVYHVEDIWDSKEKTADKGWSDEVKEEMTKFGEELPFIALGEDYTAEYDADYDQLAIYDYCPDYTLLDSYGDVLLADGFSVSGSEEEGYVYKKTLESGDTLNVQFAFTTSGNTIVAYLTHSFPTAKLEEIFSEKGLVDRVPTYSGELLNCVLLTDGSIQIQMIVEEGTEDASLGQFVNDLLEAGYTQDEDGKRYTSEHGELTVYPWTYTSEYPGYLIVNVSINLGKFPLDDVNAALTSEHDEFPIPSGTSFSFELDSEYDDSCYVTVKGGDLETYLADLEKANYTIDDQYVSEHKTYIAESPSKNLIVQIQFENNSQFIINFYCEIPPVSTVSFEDVEAMFLAEGIELELPSLTDGEFTVQVQSGKIYISGASQDQLAAFEADLEEAGWTITLSYPDSDWLDATGVYNENTRAHLSIGDYIEDKGYFYISFSCDPLPITEFPQETIDAYFAGLGYQDTLPAFSGTASDFNFTDGGQLQMLVGAGNETDAVAQYQADLLAAGYTEIGPDQYGDMHYASPNFEIDVCAWDGSAYGSDGYVIVDTKEYSAPSLSFPLESVNAYLEANGLGFQFSQKDADAIDALKVEGSAYIIEEGSMYGYPYLNIAIEGECAEAVEAALAESLAAAGFEYDEEYGKYYNSDEISFSFSEDSGYTSIFIW